MAPPILDALLRLLTPEMLTGASAALGESESAVSKGLTAAFPALLVPLADRTGDSNAMQRLLSLTKDPALDSNLLTSPARAVDAIAGGGSRTGLAALAAALLPLALGERASGAGNALARYAGLGSQSNGTSLLALAAPLVLGLLRDRVERDGLGAAGLGRWLGGQREGLRAALPPGLERTATPSVAPLPAGAGRRPAWLFPLLLLLGLGALWMLLRGDRTPQVATAPAPVAAPPPTDEIVAVERMTVSLPGGAALDVPADSLEAQLVGFVESGSADEETWFDFDRLLFETGSARLRPESRQQLANVARILQAYPGVEVKIGGYTDNVGDPASNLALSQARAESVTAELVALGIAPERLAAEGYGEQHPVADNATEEGRARNRRIALRVTDK
jgi:outer membrane protein OmpA-like peptidoglycan-associated protein